MGIYNLGGGGGAPELQAKEATPLITNAQQIIVPDNGYDGLSKVTVNPMPTGTLKTPTVNSIGYVSSGVQTAGYFDTSATSGLQLSTQAAKTITPTTYSQTAVEKGKYTTGDVTVGAVSLQSKTVSPSSLPSTITQDSGYTGLSSVTIQKPFNLIPDNIAVGESIFGVTGTAKTVYKVYLKGSVINSGMTLSLTLYGDSGYIFSPALPTLNKFALISFDCNGYGTQTPPIIKGMGLVGDVNIEFSYPDSSNSLSFIGGLSESQYTEFYGSVSSTININLSTNIITINKTQDQYQFVSGTWEGYALLAFIS